MTDELRKALLCKILSGRLALTLIVGFTFSYVTCTGMLDTKDAMFIMGVVFTAYFNKRKAV